MAHSRYDAKIDTLELLNLDITQNTERIFDFDFIWAALVLEYTGIDTALEFVKNNLQTNGHFIVSIQANNGVQSVSQTGIESVKKVGTIFQLIDSEDLLNKAEEIGLKLLDKEEFVFPNGKSLQTFHFTGK